MGRATTTGRVEPIGHTWNIIEIVSDDDWDQTRFTGASGYQTILTTVEITNSNEVILRSVTAEFELYLLDPSVACMGVTVVSVLNNTDEQVRQYRYRQFIPPSRIPRHQGRIDQFPMINLGNSGSIAIETSINCSTIQSFLEALGDDDYVPRRGDSTSLVVELSWIDLPSGNVSSD